MEASPRAAPPVRAAYPDVTLVIPEMMSTREMRQNNSRYVPQRDADGRITGGSFM